MVCIQGGSGLRSVYRVCLAGGLYTGGSGVGSVYRGGLPWDRYTGVSSLEYVERVWLGFIFLFRESMV